MAPKTLTAAFPLIVKKFSDKDFVDKLEEVNQDSVIQLLMRLTQPRINKYVKKVGNYY